MEEVRLTIPRQEAMDPSQVNPPITEDRAIPRPDRHQVIIPRPGLRRLTVGAIVRAATLVPQTNLVLAATAATAATVATAVTALIRGKVLSGRDPRVEGRTSLEEDIIIIRERLRIAIRERNDATIIETVDPMPLVDIMVEEVSEEVLPYQQQHQ